jgi:hypothetical protein
MLLKDNIINSVISHVNVELVPHVSATISVSMMETDINMAGTLQKTTVQCHHESFKSDIWQEL